MKFKTKVWMLVTDTCCGTITTLFPTEEEALKKLLRCLAPEDVYLDPDYEIYTSQQLERFYFFPEELPDDVEDWYELMSRYKKYDDSFSIDCQTLELDGEPLTGPRT